jgi:hypothetical protein
MHRFSVSVSDAMHKVSRYQVRLTAEAGRTSCDPCVAVAGARRLAFGSIATVSAVEEGCSHDGLRCRRVVAVLACPATARG